jgi:hypothetical protein
MLLVEDFLDGQELDDPTGLAVEAGALGSHFPPDLGPNLLARNS